MIFKHAMLLIILLVIFIRKRSQYYAHNHTELGNVANLYDSPMDVLKEGIKKNTKTAQTKLSETQFNKIGSIADLYSFALSNNSSIKSIANKLQKHNETGNIVDLNFVPLKKNAANVTQNFSSFENLATNASQSSLNVQKISNVLSLTNKSQTQKSTVASVADLYFLTSPDIKGIYNCSYDNTVNITTYPVLANGSYVYDNHTLIPPHLVGNYDYEILYDGSRRWVPQHTRACICRLKQCITLCSDNIIEFYQDVLNDDESDDGFMDLFSIKLTLTNKTVVTRNIAKDFEHIILNDFCVPFYTLSPEKNKKLGWTLFENGTLLRHSDQVQLTKNEYCFELYQDAFLNESYYLINPLNCAKKREDLKPIEKFNYLTQVFSIPFFVLTIFAYCCLPELRNVHGKCFVSYLSCVTISYGILSYINLSQTNFDPVSCLAIGYLNHYMQLSHYTWLGIICYDTWKSFSDLNYKSSYCNYAMYGYHLPFLMTLLTFVAQNLKIDESWKPGINEYKCGLEVNKWAALLYLYGPCLIILICGLVSFILTSRIIKSNWREVVQLNECRVESPKARYTLYLRLFLMMGLSWSLDALSYIFNMCKMRSLSGLMDYINGLQGLYIFVNFIGRKRIRDIIRQRFLKREQL